jgi:hypothetical protein
MLTFFRKIRWRLAQDNKFLQYSRYAIGEIVLVVIGILIALQINNWNERRKNNLKESLLVNNIVEDLRLDSLHIGQSLNELTDQLSVVDALIATALDPKIQLKNDAMGLIRYSSDFRPISQRNHAESVSNLENESTREIIQNYFLKEDEVKDIFLEYETIIHNKIRPYLSEVGMHNLKSLYQQEYYETVPVRLDPEILEKQLGQVKFQQLLFERRLKTDSFKARLTELKKDNQELIEILILNYN